MLAQLPMSCWFSWALVVSPAPARMFLWSEASSNGGCRAGAGGAEVTRGNWCDEHVWPPLPPAPPPHMCHKHGTRLSTTTTTTTTTTMHHWRVWQMPGTEQTLVPSGQNLQSHEGSWVSERAQHHCSADKQYVRRSPSLYKTSLSFMKHETPPTQRLSNSKQCTAVKHINARTS